MHNVVLVSGVNYSYPTFTSLKKWPAWQARPPSDTAQHCHDAGHVPCAEHHPPVTYLCYSWKFEPLVPLHISPPFFDFSTAVDIQHHFIKVPEFWKAKFGAADNPQRGSCEADAKLLRTWPLFFASLSNPHREKERNIAGRLARGPRDWETAVFMRTFHRSAGRVLIWSKASKMLTGRGSLHLPP